MRCARCHSDAPLHGTLELMTDYGNASMDLCDTCTRAAIAFTVMPVVSVGNDFVFVDDDIDDVTHHLVGCICVDCDPDWRHDDLRTA